MERTFSGFEKIFQNWVHGVSFISQMKSQMSSVVKSSVLLWCVKQEMKLHAWAKCSPEFLSIFISTATGSVTFTAKHLTMLSSTWLKSFIFSMSLSQYFSSFSEGEVIDCLRHFAILTGSSLRIAWSISSCGIC